MWKSISYWNIWISVPEIAVFSTNIDIFSIKNVGIRNLRLSKLKRLPVLNELSPCAPAETVPFWPPIFHYRTNISLYFGIISMDISNIAWPDPIWHSIWHSDPIWHSHWDAKGGQKGTSYSPESESMLCFGIRGASVCQATARCLTSSRIVNESVSWATSRS